MATSVSAERSELAGDDPQRNDMLENVLFRSTIDSEFRSALLNEPQEVVSARYGIEPAFLRNHRFVETGDAFGDGIPLPRMIEEGAALSHRELLSLGLSAVASCIFSCFESCDVTCNAPPPPISCWLTSAA